MISPIGGKQFSGVTPIAIAGSYFYFVERSSPGPGLLWVTDGTTLGTHMVRDHSGPVSNVSRGVAMDGSRLLFSRLGQQAESSVWVVDPFVLIASLLVDFRFVEVSKQPRFEAKINSGFLFVAADAIWSTDGTREGTKRLGDFDTNRMSLLSSSDSTAFFWRKGPRMEFVSYDGTVAESIC